MIINTNVSTASMEADQYRHRGHIVIFLQIRAVSGSYATIPARTGEQDQLTLLKIGQFHILR